MGSRFTIPVPDDLVFARDLCSYGYFLLAPNRWDPSKQTLTRPFDLDGGVATLTIGQPGPEGATLGRNADGRALLGLAGAPLAVVADRALSRREKTEAAGLIARMLSMGDGGVAEFHRIDPRWASGGPGLGRARLSRSPTFFEDVVKTVTSCNVAWPNTVGMNRRLCAVVHPAFPSPQKLARVRPSTLRARCAVGYRDVRLVRLAQMATSGELDEHWFTDPANDDQTVYKALLELPGIGPYGAGNIMQLLGRYSRLAIDTESVRHGREVLGLKGTDREVQKRLEAHYAGFGDHRFRSYWFEVWRWYEERRGPSWAWDPDEVGSSFTASKFRAEGSGGAPGAGGARRRSSPAGGAKSRR
ncbi:MAG: hypothetical protein IBJ10_00415 [Phycisphaerales bacterium]|nr:hypothetical protein [Phycisphaerales bacterium]